MKFAFSFIFFAIIQLAISAQTADLNVNISNIKPYTGNIMIAIFNSKETYFEMDKMLAGYEISVDSSSVSCTFSDLPIGIYAITIYHDQDSNGEMNRNWLGMPTEGYAFSNNFASSIRPASFDDASFKLKTDATLEIRMNY
jgi:uncharacterized protein (DUF2141 family)